MLCNRFLVNDPVMPTIVGPLVKLGISRMLLPSGAPRAAEVERLLALGARIRDEHDNHTVMLDPEGNQFCIGDWRTSAPGR